MLHVLLQRSPGQKLVVVVVVVDSLHVYKGIVEWSVNWRRHRWYTASGEVGHRDLWEQNPWEHERVGADLLIR